MRMGSAPVPVAPDGSLRLGLSAAAAQTDSVCHVVNEIRA